MNEKNNKKCTNCGKYPFCEKIVSATDFCEEWEKRKIEFFKKIISV